MQNGLPRTPNICILSVSCEFSTILIPELAQKNELWLFHIATVHIKFKAKNNLTSFTTACTHSQIESTFNSGENETQSKKTSI